MIEARCIATRITDVLDVDSQVPYRRVLKPIDYDFLIPVGRIFKVAAIEYENNFLKYYVFKRDFKTKDFSYPFLQVCHAPLFDIISASRVSEYSIVPSKNKFTLIHDLISREPHWFEYYIDGDQGWEKKIENLALSQVRSQE